MASLETLFILTIVILALLVALTNTVKQNQRKLAQLEASLDLLRAALGVSLGTASVLEAELSSLSNAVREALEQGQINQAIQLYRAEHHLSLHAAELAIQAIIRSMAATSNAANANTSVNTSAS